MALRISGKVLDVDTSQAVPDVVVRVMDRDLFHDDPLGECRSDASGAFRVEFGDQASRDLFADRPDVYVVVEDSGGRTLTTTRDEILADVKGDLELDVHVTHAALAEAGLARPLTAEWMREVDPAEARALAT